MNVVSRPTITEFWTRHPRAKDDLERWYTATTLADWNTPAEVLTTYPTADVVGDNRIVFNIRGNEYRLIAHIRYRSKNVFIKFVGTHKEYNGINAETINA